MKKKFILLLIILSIVMVFTACTKEVVDTGTQDKDMEESHKIVDMAGREIDIPKDIGSVFSTDSVGTIMLYTLQPDKMVGWNYSLRDGEKKYIDKRYHNLPDLGGAGKSSINFEELLKINPDILIEMGNIDEAVIKGADELQAKLNIPVVLIDGHIENLDRSYKLLGEILKENQRAEELSDYIKDVLSDVREKSSSISEEKKINIYYAEGSDGLDTEPAGAWHAEVIDMIGGKNVADVGVAGVKGKTEVSIEQVISWNPDIIISWDDERGGYYSKILFDPKWEDIKAVKNKEVYEIVNYPFNWFDRPPSVNRVLGLQWMGNLVYPELYDYNMKDVVKEFYSKFYHYELNEYELEELLKNAIR